MTTPANDPFQSLKDAWQLYLKMDEGLAESHARAVFAQQSIDDGWDDLSGRVDSTKTDLYTLAGPSDTHKERRHNRHDRNEIAGVDETLDETYESLTSLSDALVGYLKLEQDTKRAMDSGGTGDLESLDMARSKVSKTKDRLRQSRSTLALRIENLADDSGSGLFTPNT
jgi:hypothetical protein